MHVVGRFAVKKIAVGQSHEYLLNALREVGATFTLRLPVKLCRSKGNQVRLLETMHHPNIITYHHAWLETTRFSSFGPSVPTLL